MLGITEEETKAQAEKSCIMTDKNERACYVAGYLGGYEAAETERQEYEKTLLQSNLDQMDKIVLLSQKVYDLQKAYDKQIEATLKLEKENAELKADNDARKFAMAMSEKVEKQLREENAELKEQISIKDILIKELQEQKVYWKESSFDWRHKFFKKGSTKRLVQKDKQLTKAKEIIKKIEKIFYSGEDALKRLSKISDILAEAEQFLKGESTAEQPNECHDCVKFDEMPKGPRCKTCDNGSHFQKKEGA